MWDQPGLLEEPDGVDKKKNVQNKASQDEMG